MKTYPSGKIFYDQADKEKALNVNLIDFLQSRYPGEIFYNKEKARWCREDDHSVEIYSDKRKRFLKEYQSYCAWGEGGVAGTGDNINYMQKYHDMSFTEAITALLDYGIFSDTSSNERRAAQTKKDEDPAKPSPLPRRNDTYDLNTKYYLTEFRSLDKALVDDCFEKGLIFSADADSSEWCRICFHNPANGHWSLKGIARKRLGGYGATSFQRVSAGNGYWVYTTGEHINTVYITEAPIDALSLCDLLHKKADCAYVAMCGLKPEAARQAFADFPEAERRFICTDWDPEGIKFWRRNFELEGIKYLHPKPPLMTLSKDWNDVLKELRASDTIS